MDKVFFKSFCVFLDRNLPHHLVFSVKDGNEDVS